MDFILRYYCILRFWYRYIPIIKCVSVWPMLCVCVSLSCVTVCVSVWPMLYVCVCVSDPCTVICSWYSSLLSADSRLNSDRRNPRSWSHRSAPVNTRTLPLNTSSVKLWLFICNCLCILMVHYNFIISFSSTHYPSLGKVCIFSCMLCVFMCILLCVCLTSFEALLIEVGAAAQVRLAQIITPAVGRLRLNQLETTTLTGARKIWPPTHTQPFVSLMR